MCSFIIIFVMVSHNADAVADGHDRYIFLLTINLELEIILLCKTILIQKIRFVCSFDLLLYLK